MQHIYICNNNINLENHIQIKLHLEITKILSHINMKKIKPGGNRAIQATSYDIGNTPISSPSNIANNHHQQTKLGLMWTQKFSLQSTFCTPRSIRY